MLYHLYKDNHINTLTDRGTSRGSNEEGIEFGAIDVYTCINSCSGRIDKGVQSAVGATDSNMNFSTTYMQEFVLLQPPTATHYRATSDTTTTTAAASSSNAMDAATGIEYTVDSVTK